MEVAQGLRSGKVQTDRPDINFEPMNRIEQIEAELDRLKKCEAELRKDILRINLKISKVREVAYKLGKIVKKLKQDDSK